MPEPASAWTALVAVHDAIVQLKTSMGTVSGAQHKNEAILMLSSSRKPQRLANVWKHAHCIYMHQDGVCTYRQQTYSHGCSTSGGTCINGLRPCTMSTTRALIYASSWTAWAFHTSALLTCYCSSLQLPRAFSRLCCDFNTKGIGVMVDGHP